MAHAERECSDCGGGYRPRSKYAADRGTCWGCAAQAMYGTRAPARRICEACSKSFVVPKDRPDEKRCPEDRRLAERPREENPYAGFDGGELPKEARHILAPPLKQAVFDLETWGLDRSWGVVMVGSILVFGGGQPKMHTFTLRETEGWGKGVRSNDAELVAKILSVLGECDLLIGHNSRWFDIPYLNSVALKFGMPRLYKKLIDPVQIARRTYRLGSNSLSSVADFLGLEEKKMPVEVDVWRRALLDDDGGAWDTLKERCESDVRVLSEIAGRVTQDAGLIDYSGSAPRR